MRTRPEKTSREGLLPVGLVLGAVQICCIGAQVPSGRVPHVPSLPDHAGHDDPRRDGAVPDGPIRWIQDDFEAARTAAAAERVPLVIDIWATWCAPCLEMHRTVLSDDALGAYAHQFAWLMLDAEAAANRYAFQLYKTDRWPTFLVVDPDSEQVIERFEGGTSLSRFTGFLERGIAGYERGPGDAAHSALFALVRKARRAAFDGAFAEAAALYEEAVASAPAPLRPALLRSLATSSRDAGDLDGCVDAARSALALEISADTLDAVALGAECAEAESDGRFREEAATVLHDRAVSGAGAGDTALWSRALKLLRDLHLLRGDDAAARQAAGRQQRLLDKAVSEAASPASALRFDRDRAEVYLFLQDTSIWDALDERARNLPARFEPQVNRAWLAYRLGRLDDALEAATLAVDLAPDPDRGEVLFLLADIFRAKNDADNEGQVRRFLVDYYQSLPLVLAPEGALARAMAALAEFASSHN